MDEMLAGLSMEAFALWLQGQPEEAVVGVVGNDGGSPLAWFLNEVLGGQWEVTACYYANLETQRWGNVPAWAREFGRRCVTAYGHGAELQAWQAVVRLSMVCQDWEENSGSQEVR